MKKRMLSVLLAMSMLFGMTACKKGTEEKAAEDTDPKVKISFLSRYANPENRRDQYYLGKLEEFKESHPNVEIEDLSVVEGDSYISKMKTLIASGNVPDLFICSYEMPRLEMAENHTIADLEPLIESESWTGPADKKWFEGYSFEADGVEGIYGIPNALGTAQIFVNKKIFEDLKLEIPKTWEDLEKQIPVFQNAGIIPCEISAKATPKCSLLFTMLAVKMYGPEIQQQFKNKTVDWTSPEMMAVLDKYKELIDSGVFGSDAVSYSFDNCINDFKDGKTAMLIEYSFMFTTIQDAEIAQDVTCINLLGFEDQPEYWDLWYTDTFEGFCIGSKPDTPEYEAAVDLLTLLLSQDTFNGCAEVMGGGAYPLDVDWDRSNAIPFMLDFEEAYAGCDNITAILPAYLGEAALSDLTASEVQTLFVGRSPEEVAKTLDAEYKKILQK